MRLLEMEETKTDKAKPQSPSDEAKAKLERLQRKLATSLNDSHGEVSLKRLRSSMHDSNSSAMQSSKDDNHGSGVTTDKQKKNMMNSQVQSKRRSEQRENGPDKRTRLRSQSQGRTDEPSEEVEVKENNEILVDEPPAIIAALCWQCNKPEAGKFCALCPRRFHPKCFVTTREDLCPECDARLTADNEYNGDQDRIKLDRLCELLQYALHQMKMVTQSEYFDKAVDLEIHPNYSKYISNPMDLTLLGHNIKNQSYGSTAAFLADVKWLYYNSLIYNSWDSEITLVARNIVKACKQELEEIDKCADCYYNCYNMNEDWFIQVCKKPHVLLWARLKGYPYWPAKAYSFNRKQQTVDVKFFGGHEKAWLPVKGCFLYSKNPPLGSGKKAVDLNRARREVSHHITKLREKFGVYIFLDDRIPYQPEISDQQLKMMIPGWSSSASDGTPTGQDKVDSKIENETEDVSVKGDKGESIKTKTNGKVEEARTEVDDTSTEYEDEKDEQRTPEHGYSMTPGRKNIVQKKTHETATKDSATKKKLVSSGPLTFKIRLPGKGMPPPKRPLVVSESNDSPKTQSSHGVSPPKRSLVVAESNDSPKSQSSHGVSPPKRSLVVAESNDSPKSQNSQGVPPPKRPLVVAESNGSPKSQNSQGVPPPKRPLVVAESNGSPKKQNSQGVPPPKRPLVVAESNDSPKKQNSQGSSPKKPKLPKTLVPMVSIIDINRSLGPSTSQSASVHGRADSFPDKKVNKISPKKVIKKSTSPQNKEKITITTSKKVPLNGQIVYLKALPPNENLEAQKLLDNVQSSKQSLDKSSLGIPQNTAPTAGPSNVIPSFIISNGQAFLANASTQLITHNVGSQLLQVVNLNGGINANNLATSTIDLTTPNASTPPQLCPVSGEMISTPAVEPIPSTSAATSASGIFSDTVENELKRQLPKMTKAMLTALSETLKAIGDDWNSSQKELFISQQKQTEIAHKRVVDELKGELSKLKRKYQNDIRTLSLQRDVELNRVFDENKLAIEETKQKQWCAMCRQEALFYCCWNTSYCNYPCQQQHWPSHMSSCAQVSQNHRNPTTIGQNRRRHFESRNGHVRSNNGDRDPEHVVDDSPAQHNGTKMKKAFVYH